MSYIYLTPIFIILGVLAYVFYQFFIRIYIDAYRFKRMDKNLRVFVTPFTGLLGRQRKCLEKHNDTHYFIKQMVRENPDLKGYITNLGNRPFLILCEAQIIKDFLHQYKKFRKLAFFKNIEKSYSKGIFFAPDDDWAPIRSIVSHSFNNEQLKKMMPAMMDSIEKFAERIKVEVQASPQNKRYFSVVHESQLLIGQILVRTFFSQDATKKKVMGKSLSLALADFTTLSFDRARTGSNVLAFMLFGQNARKINLFKEDKYLGELVDAIRVALFEILDERIAKYREEDEKDFLNNYIYQMNKAEYEIKQAEVLGVPPKARRITKQQILHQLISFYFAGIDTTGHLVAFSLYAMTQYPQIQQKVKAQINQLFKSKEDVTFDNLKKMIYTGKYINQCLRMWPPATGILARVAKQDIKIGPYEIPSGMIVGINIIGLMHNPKYYDNPEIFNPDRWSDQKGNHAEQPYAFIPFSAGGKSCIGKYLALMQTKLILISFYKNFDLIRSEIKLRLTAKFLYEPLDDKLIYLTDKGAGWQQKPKVE